LITKIRWKSDLNTAENNILSEIEKIKVAAEEGDAEAQFRLGWDYYIGNGVTRDKIKAVEWYNAAANQGFRKAQEILDILEANKMLESKESFVDAEENELRTLAFRSRKWKVLAAFIVLCAFIGLLLHYIGDNVQWFCKEAKIETSGAQSDLNVVDVEMTIGDQTESTEALRAKTQSTDEEMLIELEDAGTDLMKRLAIFADKWLEGDSESNEAREQEAEPAKRQD